MAALKKGAGEVCLLGCELKGKTLEICGQIKEQLEAAGLEVSTLTYVLYDEILKELELLQRQEITVLGGIVAE